MNNSNRYIAASTEPRYDYKLKRIGRLAKSSPEYIAAIALSNKAREVGRLEHLIPGVGNNTRSGIKFNGMYSATFEAIGVDRTCLVDEEAFCGPHNINHNLEIIEAHTSALTNAYATTNFAEARPEVFANAVLYITDQVIYCVPRVNQLAVLTEVVRRFQRHIAEREVAAGDSEEESRSVPSGGVPVAP